MRRVGSNPCASGQFPVTSFSLSFDANGGNGADNMTGTAARDTLSGGNGADTLRGAGEANDVTDGTGNDDVFGGDGNDVFTSGPGADTFNGGAGVDDVSYSAGTEGVQVFLGTTSGDGVGAENDDYWESSRMSLAGSGPTSSAETGTRTDSTALSAATI